MSSIFGIYEGKNDINTWISSVYCSKWGLKEAIREILQNQRDEIVNQLGQENIESKSISKYDFNFLKKGTNEIYGKIRYDKLRSILSIENKGKLETFNLLLGGTTRKNNSSPGIIGQFGEGLKIAAIALLRENKMISIINNNQVWRFSLKEDENFIRENKPEKCLFWRWEEYSKPDNENKVIIEIRNITLSEWEENLSRYLWLASKVYKLGIITAGRNGDIILNPDFRNRVYSRGVYVTTVRDGRFGYNMDLILDRDRNYIPDYDSFESKARKIIIYILDHYLEYKNQIENKQLELMDYSEIKMLEKFPERILQLLDEHNTFLGSEYFNLTPQAADYLWELNAQLRKETDKNFSSMEMDLIPQPLDKWSRFIDFVNEKNLSCNFYPYFECTTPLYNALKNSKYFISYEAKFEKFYKKKKIIIPQNNDGLEKIINSIILKIRLFDSSFDRSSIVFQELEPEEAHFTDNNKYYFSSLLFNKPKKMEKFVFGKCLEKLHVSIIDLLEKFNFVIKDYY